jgi:opacity protein-like surface antigen
MEEGSMRSIPIIVVAALVFWSSPLEAQWRVGGVAGLNLASISVDPDPSSEEYSSRLGFGFGAVVDRELSEGVDLRFEPMFLMKGSKIEEDGDEATQKLTYLEVPILVRYHFPSEGSAQPYVMAGPSVGFLLSAKFDFEDGPEYDGKDETKSTDFGLAIGGGVEVPHGNLTLFAEGRYVLGLTNINDEIDQSGESTVKNRGLQIFVGATVPVGR